MTSRAHSIDLVRHLVRGDHHAYRRGCAELDEKGWQGFGLVVGAAFYSAVRRWFNGSYVAADVIRFVADFRAEIAGSGFDVEPQTAESLVRAALTGETELVDDMDPPVIVETELLMLWKLLGHLSDTELTLFFQEADALAEKWSR
jgi:hypothetical protein